QLPSWTPGQNIPGPPFPTTNPNSPGGREFPMAWTDNQGNRWLFGGYGFEVAHQGVQNLPGFLDDMWVWPTSPSPSSDEGWWVTGAWVPANLPIIHEQLGNSYHADTTPIQLLDQGPSYGTLGSGVPCSPPVQPPAFGCTDPGARWGGITWT